LYGARRSGQGRPVGPTVGLAPETPIRREQGRKSRQQGWPCYSLAKRRNDDGREEQGGASEGIAVQAARMRTKLLATLNKLTPDELLKICRKNPSTFARLATHLTPKAGEDQAERPLTVEYTLKFDSPAGELEPPKPVSKAEQARRDKAAKEKRLRDGPWKNGRPHSGAVEEVAPPEPPSLAAEDADEAWKEKQFRRMVDSDDPEIWTRM